MSDKKARSGRPAGRLLRSASAYNRSQEVGEVYEKQERLGTGTDPRRSPIPTDCLKIKNTSGSSRSRGDALEISGLQTTAIDPEALLVTGITPSDEGQPFAILRYAVPNNGFAVAQVSGVCLARIDITNASHTRAKLAASTNNLVSAYGGPVGILYKPSGTGIKECLALISDVGMGGSFVGKSNGTITARSGTTAGSGTIDLYYRTSTATISSLSRSVTAYNTTTTAIATGRYVHVKQDPFGDFWVDVDDC